MESQLAPPCQRSQSIELRHQLPEIRKYGNNPRKYIVAQIMCAALQKYGNTDQYMGEMRELMDSSVGEVNPLRLTGSSVHTIYNCQRYLLSL